MAKRQTTKNKNINSLVGGRVIVFLTIKQIEDIQKNIDATLAVENKKASKTGKEINTYFLEGKITSNEAIKKIIEHYIAREKNF